MSFKIFSLQFFGKLKSTEKIEQTRRGLLADYNEYIEVDESQELVEYLKLEEFVNSEEFKKQKIKIESLQFKGSREYNQLLEFRKLKKTKHIKRYFTVLKSPELKKFDGLKGDEKLKQYDILAEYVKEGQYDKDKKEIKSQVYRNSVEEKHFIDFKKLAKSAGIKAWIELNGSEKLKNHQIFTDSERLKKFVAGRNATGMDKEKLKEYKALKKAPDIKAYFKFEKSKKLRLYHETVDSYDLKRYKKLKEYVENETFNKRVNYLKDKRKFEKTEAYVKKNKFKELAADPDIKFFLKYEKSAAYKNFLDVKDSFDLKRYYELETITTSEQFAETRSYLDDKNKWQKTEEYKKQQVYLDLKKQAKFVNYFKNRNTTKFDFYKNWELAFEDDFLADSLNDEKWSTCGFVAEKLLGKNYSMPGDKHFLTSGENIRCGGKLCIDVKREKQIAQVWNVASGFVPKEMEYSTGIVSSGKSFWQENGIFEAKIKFNPIKQVVNSFYLLGDKNSPRVNLLEMGTKNRIGFSSLDKQGKIKHTGLDISTLKKGEFYIFSLEKQGKEFTWKINDLEVFKVSSTDFEYPLHMNASNIVVYDIPDSVLPYSFEIEWVKCYRTI